MLNKIYKNIHTKKSKILIFYFYLMCLTLLFLFVFSIFLSFPKLVDQQNKSAILKDYFVKNYRLELKNYSKIEYNIFPLPNLTIQDVNFEVKNDPINITSKDVRIFLNFQNIYNKKVIVAKKLLVTDVEITLDINSSSKLLSFLKNLKKKFHFKTGLINFLKEKNTLFQIKNFSYSNYGFKKNQFKGNLFDKDFKISIKGQNEDVLFEIYDSGVKAHIKFDKIKPNKSVSGSSDIQILNNLLKFDFKSSEGIISIENSSFKNEDLLISHYGSIKFDPFFYINSNIKINKINENFFNEVDLEKLLSYKEIIKKINGTNKIIFINDKLIKGLINNTQLNFNLAYGRLDFEGKLDIAGGEIFCKGDGQLTEDYPRLFFDCKFDISEQNKIFRKFSLKDKVTNENFVLDILGDLNLFNGKINFKVIRTDKNYNASAADKKFIKNSFEKILFDDGFFNIFKFEKIKNFLNDII